MLPYRCADLELVNDVAASGERLSPVRRKHANIDGHIADLERAGAVRDVRDPDSELRHSFRGDALDFLAREYFVRLILEMGYVSPLIVIANDPRKRDLTTAFRR